MVTNNPLPGSAVAQAALKALMGLQERRGWGEEQLGIARWLLRTLASRTRHMDPPNCKGGAERFGLLSRKGAEWEIGEH